MWYDETIKNMAFQRDKVLGSCMTEDEEEAKMLNAILDELKLNALVITDPYNMRHVSGFRGGEGALYISAAQKVLITDSRYTEQAGKESDFTVIEECRGHNCRFRHGHLLAAESMIFARLRLRKNWSIWQKPKKSGTKHLQNF